MSSRRRGAGSRARPTSCAYRFRGIARWCSCILPAERLRRLRGVRMLRAGVDLQLRDLLTGEPVLREHALHGAAQDLLRTTVELLAKRSAVQPARVAGVPVVALLVELVAGDLDLLGVDDDHEVAGVHVRRVGRLALAAQRVGDTRRQASEGLALGVDDVPLTGDLAWLCGVGLHRRSKKRRSEAPAGGES